MNAINQVLNKDYVSHALISKKICPIENWTEHGHPIRTKNMMLICKVLVHMDLVK